MTHVQNQQICKIASLGALPAFHLFTVLILGIYYVGLAVSVDMDYSIRDVSQAALLERALSHSPASLLHDDHTREHLWFIPFAVVTGLCIQFLRSKRQSLWIRATALLVPSIVLGPIILPLGFYLPWFLAVPLDGETLAESWPAASAAGAWTIVTVFLLTIRNRGVKNRAE